MKVVLLSLFVLFALLGCHAIQVTDPNFSFSSQNVQTQLLIKRDASRDPSKGIELTVSISGSGAPQVTAEEVLSVSGGNVEVKAGNPTAPPIAASASLLRQSSPFFLSLLVGVFGLLVGTRSRFIGVAAIALAMVGGAIALQAFDPNWTVQVTATVPSSLSLSSLSINIARGNVVVENDVDISISGNTNVDLCKNAGNFVKFDGASLALSGTSTFCATHQLLLNNVDLARTANLQATSQQDAAFVFVKSTKPYTGAFTVTSTNGYAITTPCAAKQMSTEEQRDRRGHCGNSSPSARVSGTNDAVLALSEDPYLNAKRWSDPLTWGGQVPGNNSNVTIAQNQVILLDTTTAALNNLEIRGVLIADPQSSFSVTAGSIHVYGTLRVGSVHTPYSRQGVFTLTGAKGNYTRRPDPLLGFSNPATSRVIFGYSGATIQLFGLPKTSYTRLNDHAAANATVLTLDSVTGWQVGDVIAISPTTFPSTSTTDRRTIVSINAAARQVTIDTGLSYGRWGKLQYATDNGISLDQGVFETYKAHVNVTNVLDERAVVINLSRNIVVQAINDSDWQAGHGAHIMWMGPTTTAQLSNIEVTRAGQAGALGRYPIHAHMQSYSMVNAKSPSDLSDGTYVGEASGVFVRNCAVHNSANRAYTIHGTCGARFENNVAYDIRGHAFFLEDGSEIRNHILGNVMLYVRSPPTRILLHDDSSSGFWFTNGNNHFRNNIAGDIKNGFGIWNALAWRNVPSYVDVVAPGGITFSNPGLPEWQMRAQPKLENWTLTYFNATHWNAEGTVSGKQQQLVVFGQDYQNGIISVKLAGTSSPGGKVTFRIDGYAGGCFGQSRYVALHPQYTPIFDYTNNTAFACARSGIVTDLYPVDEQGNLGARGFISTNDSLPDEDHNGPRKVPTHFDRHRLWMNEGGGYSNRVYDPLYTGWLAADNAGTDISGATQHGQLSAALFVGHSLNKLEPKLAGMGRHAFATYHFSVDFINITFFNYPKIPNPAAKTAYELLDMSGVMTSWDLYLSSVEMGLMNSANWRKFNCAAFERTPPPNLEYLYPNNSGGSELPYGRHWTFSGAMYDPAATISDKSDQFLIYDHPFLTHNLSNSRPVSPGSLTLATTDRFYGIHLFACDSDRPAYDSLTFERLDKDWKVVANMSMNDGETSRFFGNMRHASLVKYGIYRMYNHANRTPNRRVYAVQINNGFTKTNASFIIGFPWAGDARPNVDVRTDGMHYNYPVPVVYSRAALLATPWSFWHDRANNELWYHHNYYQVRSWFNVNINVNNTAGY